MIKMKPKKYNDRNDGRRNGTVDSQLVDRHDLGWLISSSWICTLIEFEIFLLSIAGRACDRQTVLYTHGVKPMQLQLGPPTHRSPRMLRYDTLAACLFRTIARTLCHRLRWKPENRLFRFTEAIVAHMLTFEACSLACLNRRMVPSSPTEARVSAQAPWLGTSSIAGFPQEERRGQSQFRITQL